MFKGGAVDMVTSGMDVLAVADVADGRVTIMVSIAKNTIDMAIIDNENVLKAVACVR